MLSPPPSLRGGTRLLRNSQIDKMPDFSMITDEKPTFG
jgi:hypothetical protein